MTVLLLVPRVRRSSTAGIGLSLTLHLVGVIAAGVYAGRAGSTPRLSASSARSTIPLTFLLEAPPSAVFSTPVATPQRVATRPRHAHQAESILPRARTPEVPPTRGLLADTLPATLIVTAHFDQGSPVVIPSPTPLEPASADTRPDPERAVVRPAGFERATPAPRSAPADHREVHSGGFDLVPAPVAVAGGTVALALAPIDRPVEIIFKPAPDYTDEAKARRVEGVVTLEVEFASSGEVRVLRLVHGLGHGLDEAAARAARRIRFRPARANGDAVDCRATVHISFRLS